MTRFRALRRSLVCLVFALLAAPATAQSNAEPIRIGFLSVRTGALAAGGKHMEEGINLFWTFDAKKFLASPVYSRDYPAMKN